MQKYDYLVSGTFDGFPFTWSVMATDDESAKQTAIQDLKFQMDAKQITVEKVECLRRISSEV